MMLKKGTEVELTIQSAAFKGKGVARYDGLAVFVPGTAPGDQVLARITRRKKSWREAKLLKILQPSPDRVKPRCIHADVCGGCTWQHLPYKTQLEIKSQQVKDHMQRIAGLDPSIVEPITGCGQEFHYRNKMEYSFGMRRWLTQDEIEQDEFIDDTGFFAGLHAPGRYDKILNLHECHLPDPVSFPILHEVRSYSLNHGITAYDPDDHKGFLRNLVIRTSAHTSDLMVNIVTSSWNEEIMNGLCDHLLTQFPTITTVVNNINDGKNPTAVGRLQHLLYGPGSITDSIGEYHFAIDPNAFFQTNTLQAEKLYSIAKEFASLEPEDLLYDLYSGVGTLTLFMSGDVKKAVGIELSEVSVQNARKNAQANGVNNVSFVLGDMKDTFTESLLRKNGKPDCILTDPPRSGMHPDVVRQLMELRTPKMVYISCNPSTMARDLSELKEIYNIDRIRPVDMFPQTWHIEAVARLTLRSDV